ARLPPRGGSRGLGPSSSDTQRTQPALSFILSLYASRGERGYFFAGAGLAGVVAGDSGLPAAGAGSRHFRISLRSRISKSSSRLRKLRPSSELVIDARLMIIGKSAKAIGPTSSRWAVNAAP